MKRLLEKFPRELRAPLVLGFFVLLFFHKMAFSNLILARGDVFRYFYPYWSAAAAALRAGEVPLWNTQIFMGAPLLANSQMGFFYPLNWPLWLLLPVPYALSAAILLHVWLAGWGAYAVGRRMLRLEETAALLAGGLFALGGYVSAQVEHINQLQGIAWMPWLLLVLMEKEEEGARPWPSLLRKISLIALLFGLQLTAGHTQTTFISGVMLLLWLAGTLFANQAFGGDEPARLARRSGYWRLGALAAGGLLALAASAVQLLPTLELIGQSSRQGGLAVNEVLSFSLHPALLTRSFLPAWGQTLATEYVAFIPVSGWLLLFLALGPNWRRRGVLPAIFLAVAGLFLAFGAYNPVNWGIARLPGFNLFRAPARWLLLSSFGGALLIGSGWDGFWRAWQKGEVAAWRDGRKRAFYLFGLFFLFLLVWNWGGGLLVRRLPAPAEAPFAAARPLSLTFWLLEVGITLVVFGFFSRKYSLPGRFRHPYLILALILVVQFSSTRLHPYHNLTTPEAYFDLRAPVARLQAVSADTTPPARLLSLSNIFFDVGDQAEIDTIYAEQLPPEAQYDYTVAMKMKEIIDGNLVMIYGLSSVDGFDGGILPLTAYTTFSELLLGEGRQTTDGRLREFLTTLPADQWLDFTNTRYLITDKTGDLWRELPDSTAVFFDRQHPVQVAPDQPVAVGFVPTFAATAVYVLAPHGGTLLVQNEAGAGIIAPESIGDDLLRFPLPSWAQEAATANAFVLQSEAGTWPVTALTLVNEEDDTFYSLVPGAYRLLYSGDVKIYENLDVLPRAFLVGNWETAVDGVESSQKMGAPGFDPRVTAVVEGNLPVSGSFDGILPLPEITGYAPTRIEISVQGLSEVDQPVLLLLTDADYPGWEAWVDGEQTQIYTVNGMFRAVLLEADAEIVQFQYRSLAYERGWLVSCVSLLLIGGMLITPVLVRGRGRRP